MHYPAPLIPNARQFRRELETIYRIQLPELDVPRGWLPRVELIVETLACQDLLHRTSFLAIRQRSGLLSVAIEAPYHAQILVRRLIRDAPSDCKHCGGKLIDPMDGGRHWCASCPGGRQRAGRRPC